mgnify:CR=1 FL=1
MADERTPILSVQDLSVNYGAIQALRGISLDVFQIGRAHV